jgi:hypothetical protein
MLHQVGDLFELNVKFRGQNLIPWFTEYSHADVQLLYSNNNNNITIQSTETLYSQACSTLHVERATR